MARQKSRRRNNRNRHLFPIPKPTSIDNIDYSNVEVLKGYITETGRILSQRITRVSTKKQHKITKEIKRARFLALLPYTDRHALEHEGS